jgi:hypothetical protein
VAAAPAAPSQITEIRIEGAGRHTVGNPGRDLQLVDEFVKNLKQSPFFDPEGVEIVVPPNPMLREPTFRFTLRAKLARPIPI